MNTTKFKLELGTIPETIPELTPVSNELEPKTKPESEPKLEPDLEPKTEPESEPKQEVKLEPESEPKLEVELNSKIKKIDSILTVDESIKTLTQSINYHDYDESLPHFIEHDKAKIKKVMFNFEPIIPNNPIIPNDAIITNDPNEPIHTQKDIPELDSEDSYCTCLSKQKNSDS